MTKLFSARIAGNETRAATPTFHLHWDISFPGRRAESILPFLFLKECKEPLCPVRICPFRAVRIMFLPDQPLHLAKDRCAVGGRLSCTHEDLQRIAAPEMVTIKQKRVLGLTPLSVGNESIKSKVKVHPFLVRNISKNEISYTPNA